MQKHRLLLNSCDWCCTHSCCNSQVACSFCTSVPHMSIDQHPNPPNMHGEILSVCFVPPACNPHIHVFSFKITACMLRICSSVHVTRPQALPETCPTDLYPNSSSALQVLRLSLSVQKALIECDPCTLHGCTCAATNPRYKCASILCAKAASAPHCFIAVCSTALIAFIAGKYAEKILMLLPCCGGEHCLAEGHEQYEQHQNHQNSLNSWPVEVTHLVLVWSWAWLLPNCGRPFAAALGLAAASDQGTMEGGARAVRDTHTARRALAANTVGLCRLNNSWEAFNHGAQPGQPSRELQP